MLLSFPVKNT